MSKPEDFDLNELRWEVNGEVNATVMTWDAMIFHVPSILTIPTKVLMCVYVYTYTSVNPCLNCVVDL